MPPTCAGVLGHSWYKEGLVHELGLIWRLLDSVWEGQFFLTMLRLQFGHTSPEVPERMFSTRIGILARKVRGTSAK